MHQEICTYIDQIGPELCTLADEIFDHPEVGLEEYFACDTLCGYLEQLGFTVERGIAGLETAFRAVWENGTGGPAIGMLCEYDALKGMGHACGHHTQGPCAIGAAAALKHVAGTAPFKLVLYGTPAEETCASKITMLEQGCFRDMDVVLKTHLGPETCVDKHTRALDEFEVTFRGKSAHAAISPELGRSALDALLLTFHGLEFLREHVPDDVRIHYTVLDAGGPANVVPEQAKAYFELRSFETHDLADVAERFKNIVQGAALMTGTTPQIDHLVRMESLNVLQTINDLLIEKANLIHAPDITPPRESTGSTDFGNVTNLVPGGCIRLKFVPRGTAAHSQEFLKAGKSPQAHEAIKAGAKILALAGADLIEDPELLKRVRDEFEEKRRTESSFDR